MDSWIEGVASGVAIWLVRCSRCAELFLSLHCRGDDREMTGSEAVEYQVEGMSCGACVRKLESTLTRIDGVNGVEVSLEAGRAQVVGVVSQAVVLEAIESAGFQGELAG